MHLHLPVRQLIKCKKHLYWFEITVLKFLVEYKVRTIALYCSASGIRKSRWAAPASLCADLTGFLISALAVRRIFS